ncbi:MAG: pyridoxal phosphate-dependent aminotransferase [Gammaproteobacteria bacterium]|nr:pyridoxal phosphate-dependent aminotransferase [Gammaproteobacteria bacterium]
MTEKAATARIPIHTREVLSTSDTVKRLDAIDTSAWSVHIEAMKRKQAGEAIIPLSIGDPDFPTPSYIIEGVIDALKKERTHYSDSAGEMSLRSALAELECGVTGKEIKPKQFSIFNGATSAIHGTLSAIANPGDNIVTCQPTYLGYESTFVCLGVELRAAATTPPYFRYDVDRTLELIDERTVGVLVNTPSNPMGNIVPPESLIRLYEECRRRNLWLISDEVYSVMYYEKKHTSLAKLAPDFDNVVVIDSLSKSHAMSGWRVGWTLSSEEFARQLREIALGTFFSGCPFIQDAATLALLHDEHAVERMRNEYRARRDYTMSRIAQIPKFSAVSPEAGMFVMIDVHEPSDQFARRLLDGTGVSVVPGTPSGMVTRRYVRMSLTQPIPVLTEAWDRIQAWLERESS